MKRLLWALVIVCVLAAAAPYLPAGVLRTRVAAALERSLDRPVEIGDIRFTFFPAGPVPGPGFVLENVTIHEDRRAGIEPFVHTTELGASIRLFSLLQGRLELSGVSLGDATINCVKTQDNAWNIQFLKVTNLPVIRMRGGRVNFKFSDTKSVFYFNDVDLDISPGSSGSMDLRFGGEPSRTDKTAQDFGRFYVSGRASSESLDMRVEFERSSLEVLGVEGVLVALDAQISGAPTDLKVTGNVQASDRQGANLQLAYGGTLDLRGERLELASTEQKPVAVQFKAWDFLKIPEWEASADFQQIPLATLFEVGRHMGATLPENLTVDGAVAGTVNYNRRNGLSGQWTLGEASLTVPGREPVLASEAHVTIIGMAVRLAPTMVRIGEDQTAQIDGIVTLAEPRMLDLTINTKGLSVAAMQSFGLPAMPILEQTPEGRWRGRARYREGEWSGESELRGARIQVEGLATPLEIETAAVSLRGRRAALDRIRGKAGAIAFRGSYNFEPDARRPHKFNVTLEEVDGADLERLLAPALDRRGRGFLARTLGLASPPPPPWLEERRADGRIAIDSLTAGLWKIGGVKAHVLWDGAVVRLEDLTGSVEPAEFSGELTIDLTAAPKYRFEGDLKGVAWHDGILDFTGTLETQGGSGQFVQAARGEGTLKGRSIAFAPDADFGNASAQFQLQPASAGPRWKLSNVKVTQAGATLDGTGASQEDGSLSLDLSQGERAVRYNAPLSGPAGSK